MPPTKGNMHKYTEEQMENALEEVLRGLPVSTVAKKYKVPRITLMYKAKGKSPRGRKMGPETHLTSEEEKMLVTWILTVAKAGFPVTRDQLLDSVQHLINKVKRNTPFKENRPGKTWYHNFLKRNPEISLRCPQNLTASRASVTTDQIYGWFHEIEAYLKQNDLNTILQDPSRVFNGDETAFFLNPKGKKVLAARGNKTVYQHVNTDEKECLTVLFTGNAAGTLCPRMVVFKYDRIPQTITQSVPAKWGIGKSSNGWMTQETFFEFISNLFFPWLVEQNIKLPVILFIDGHASHLTLHTSKFCDEHGIILVALFPNATHLLQPMDVALFRTLKDGWQSAVHQWRIDHHHFPILKKHDFSPLLEKVIEDRVRPEILANGFRKCGLVPWNPKVPCKENREAAIIHQKTSLVRLKELQDGMSFIETRIEKEKIASFKTAEFDNWQGDLTDASLFSFYKGICLEIESIKQELRQKDNEENIEEDKDENGSGNKSDMNQNQTKYIDDTPRERSEKDITLTPEKDSPLEQGVKQPDPLVPSPFKHIWFWPEEKPQTTKRKRKEKVPSVATSKEWQLYHQKKEDNRKQLELDKKRRAEERLKNREIREKLKEEKKDSRIKKQQEKASEKANQEKKKRYNVSKTDSDSDTEAEWVESGTSIDDISTEQESEEENLEPNIPNSDFKEGDYVLVVFPGKKKEHKYVCVIQQLLENEEAEVVAMNCCNENKTIFKLDENDVSVIKFEQILTVLQFPAMIATGDRLKYQFNSPLDVDG